MALSKSLAALLMVASLASCAMTGGQPGSARTLPGSTVQINSTFDIPDNKARVYLQGGERAAFGEIDRWTTYCSVLMQTLQQPGSTRLQVKPGEFSVSSVRQSNDFNHRTRIFVASKFWTYDPPSNVTYKVEMRLDDPLQAAVRSLICEKRVDAYGQYYPVLAEMRRALGRHIKIEPLL